MLRRTTLCLLFLLATGASAQEPVTLLAGTDSIPLAGHIAVLRDPSGEQTLEDVRAPTAHWQHADAARFALGLTSDAVWYRLHLQAPARPDSTGLDWVLDLWLATLDEVDVHFLRPDGGVTTILTGDRRPPHPALLSHPNFAVPFRVAAGEDLTIYVRSRNGAFHNFIPTVWPAEAFQRTATVEMLLYGMYFGILMVMALYNFSIYIWIRDRANLYYVLYMLGMVAFTAVINGQARQFGEALFDGGSIVLSNAWPLSVNATTLASVLFVREFLQVRRLAPRLDVLFRLIALGVTANLMLVPFVSYGYSVAVGMAATLVTAVVGISTAGYLAIGGSRPARFYLVASAILAGSLIVSIVLGFSGTTGPLLLINWEAGVCIEAALLSLALGDRLATERRERERFARLKQYLPQKVADLVVEGNGKALLDPKRRNVTVCVIDLRGFTPFSEAAAPEDVMSVLREFYDAMGAIVEKHGGTVEHFAGDSMLIFFNAPLEIPEPEKQAVQTALEMRAAFEPLRTKWSKLGHELGLGIGIADGYATIGAIGFAGRSQYAAIGAVTNLASRLCSSAAHGEILTTSRVLAAVEDLVESQSAGEQSIKGFHRPIQVVRIVGARGPALAAQPGLEPA